MIGIFETVPDWNIYGGLSKYGNNEAYKLYYGGTDMPYGLIVNPLTWSYWELQTVYYDPPGCFSWNDQWWEGTASANPVATACGLN